MQTNARHIARAVCLAACMLLPSCLAGRGIVTGDLATLYVSPDTAQHQLRIVGTMATVPGLKPFVIDDPIVYDMERTCGNGSIIESKVYVNADGDEIVFRTKVDNRTSESWYSVVVRPREDDEFELMHLPGYFGASRARAYGIYH